MSLARKTELRFLSKEEQTTVADSHQPGLSMLPDSEVEKIREQIRGYCNAAQARSRQERSERRKSPLLSGKGSGVRLKLRALATAAMRTNKEMARRKADAAHDAE